MQSKKVNTGGSSGNSVSASLTNPVSSGSTLIVIGAVQEAVGGTPCTYNTSDTYGLGLAWTMIPAPCKNASWGPTIGYSSKFAASGSGSVTLTATAGGNNNGGMIILLEVSGLSGVLDQWAADQGSVLFQSTYLSPSITTTNPTDYIITGATIDNGATISSIATGFTVEVNASGGGGADPGCGDNNVIAAGSYAATYTLSGNCNPYGLIAAFKLAATPAAGGGGMDILGMSRHYATRVETQEEQ